MSRFVGKCAIVLLFIVSSNLCIARTAAERMHAGIPTVTLGLVQGSYGWFNSFDPDTSGYISPEFVTRLIDAGLIKLLPDGTVVPDLATYTISSDKRTYTFLIRRNSRFSNGDAVTAYDAQYSLLRALAPATHDPIALTYLGRIEGAAAFHAGRSNRVAGLKVEGRRRLVIRTDRPAPYFLSALSYPLSAVISPAIVKIWAGHPSQEYCSTNVGAGQMMLQCRTTGAGPASFYSRSDLPSLTFVPNPYYYGRKARLKLVEPFFGSYLGEYDAYLAKRVDETPLPVALLRRYRSASGFLSFSEGYEAYIALNVQHAPFNNVHCRLALAFATDRSALARDVPGSRPLRGVVPPGVPGAYTGAAAPGFDLRQSVKELKECPGRMRNVSLPYVAQDYYFNLLRLMWQSAGINIPVRHVSPKRFTQLHQEPESTSRLYLRIDGWYQDYPDAQDYCALLLRSGAFYNNGGYDNARYDALVDRADQLFDPKQRSRLYREAQKLPLAAAAFIPLTFQIEYAVVANRVHGLVGSNSQGVVPRGGDWSNVSVDG